MNSRIMTMMTVFVASVVFVGGTASAQNTRYSSIESPRHYVVEARFGSYRPAIDSDFATATPFNDVFGDGQFLMSQLEFDYELWNKVGIIALGATAGYSRMAGYGINPKTGETSSDETALNVMPLSLEFVYRFDYLAQKFRIPLVPHVKAGFDYWIWWIENGTGDVAKVTDDSVERKGYGGTWGAHVGVGIGFLLDFLAPKMAQTFDVDIGVNNTYLFFEYNWAWINDFGVGNAMNLSSGSFIGGLAFEF